MIFFRSQFIAMLTALTILLHFGSTKLLAFDSADQPKIGMSSTGNLVLVWSVYDNENASYVIRTNTWDSTTGWSPNENLSTVPGMSFDPFLAVNGAGDAAVIWTALDENHLPTLQGRIFFNGAWDASPTQFSATGESVISYQLKLIDNGTISVIWSSYPPESTDSAIYALIGSTVAGGWNVPAGVTLISD